MKRTLYVTRKPEKDSWLRPIDFAVKFSVSLNHVYRLIRDGKLRAVNFGDEDGKKSLFRIPPDEMERLINANETI
jgi:hypothetical protein